MSRLTPSAAEVLEEQLEHLDCYERDGLTGFKLLRQAVDFASRIRATAEDKERSGAKRHAVARPEPTLSARVPASARAVANPHAASPDYTIRAVDRVCDLLDLLAQSPRGISLKDAAIATDLPKSSVFRYVVSLENRRYIEQDLRTGLYYRVPDRTPDGVNTDLLTRASTTLNRIIQEVHPADGAAQRIIEDAIARPTRLDDAHLMDVLTVVNAWLEHRELGCEIADPPDHAVPGASA
jgi:hypothetical protein